MCQLQRPAISTESHPVTASVALPGSLELSKAQSDTLTHTLSALRVVAVPPTGRVTRRFPVALLPEV